MRGAVSIAIRVTGIGRIAFLRRFLRRHDSMCVTVTWRGEIGCMRQNRAQQKDSTRVMWLIDKGKVWALPWERCLRLIISGRRDGPTRTGGRRGKQRTALRMGQKQAPPVLSDEGNDAGRSPCMPRCACARLTSCVVCVLSWPNLPLNRFRCATTKQFHHRLPPCRAPSPLPTCSTTTTPPPAAPVSAVARPSMST